MKCVQLTTAELAKKMRQVIAMCQQIPQSLNSLTLQLNLAGWLAQKAEVCAIFMLGSEEESVLYNMAEFINTAKYSVSLMREGKIPNRTQ